MIPLAAEVSPVWEGGLIILLAIKVSRVLRKRGQEACQLARSLRCRGRVVDDPNSSSGEFSQMQGKDI